MEHWVVLSQIWLWITYDVSARHNWDEAKGSHKISIRGTKVKVKAWIKVKAWTKVRDTKVKVKAWTKVKGTKANWESESKS